MLEAKGRLKFRVEATAWIRRCEAIPFLTFVPVDNEIARVSVTLPDYRYADPADRMIIATAQVLGLTLISKDRKILDYNRVKSLW
jgi:PIN domain nuclease of toxin-antitoxin system